jgi:CubicO group peptidase (beta-lactamase class C family)
LEEFFMENIFKPLGMIDTSFTIPEHKRDRFVDLFILHPKEGLKNITQTLDGGAEPGGRYHPSNTWNAGGSGLVTTLDDYGKFVNCLAVQGGHPLISPTTLTWAMSNRLINPMTNKPTTLREMAINGFADNEPKGMGFGYGFAIVEDVGHYMIATRGEASWGGAASTRFFIDFKNNLTVVFMTSLLLPDPLVVPILPMLHQLVYGCMENGGGSSNSRL